MCNLILSDALNISQPRKLKYVVCMESLSWKDSEALQKFLQFDTRFNISYRFTVNRVLFCFSSVALHLNVQELHLYCPL